MSSYTTSISNIVKAAQSDALDGVLAAIRDTGAYDDTHLEQLVAAIDAYKAQNLTPEAAKKGKGAKAVAAAADKPKRKFTPNGFSVFSRDNRPAILAANPGVAPKDVMGLIGGAWKALSESEQAVYNAKAKAEAAASAAAAPAGPVAPAAAAPAEPAKAAAKATKAAKAPKA